MIGSTSTNIGSWIAWSLMYCHADSKLYKVLSIQHELELQFFIEKTTISAQIEGHSRLERHVGQIQILGHLEILGN